MVSEFAILGQNEGDALLYSKRRLTDFWCGKRIFHTEYGKIGGGGEVLYSKRRLTDFCSVKRICHTEYGKMRGDALLYSRRKLTDFCCGVLANLPY